MGNKESKRAFNRTVQRAALVLKCLGESGRPLGISEISERLGMPAATVYRIVAALEVEGLLDQDAVSRKYGLSVELFSLVRGVVRHIGFGDQVRAELRALSRKVGETVYLGVLREDRVIYLVSIETQRFLRTGVKIWSPHPAHTTAIGKAVLAFSPQEAVKSYLQGAEFREYTPGSIRNSEELLRRLEFIREHGYTFDDEECDIGVRAVGAPIRNATGKAVAGLAVAGPTARLTDAYIGSLAEDVRETARRISCLLGWDEDIYVPYEMAAEGM